MNNFFKIHKVKILRGNDNFKFLDHISAFIIIWVPLSVLRSRFFIFPKPFPTQKNKKSSTQAGAQIPVSNQHLSFKMKRCT